MVKPPMDCARVTAAGNCVGAKRKVLIAFIDGRRAKRLVCLRCPYNARRMPRLLLVVPCYNEEKRLNVAAFRESDTHFLFVNDGSSDGTLRLLESLRTSDPQRFSVLDLERNSGKAEAVRRGILAAIERRP